MRCNDLRLPSSYCELFSLIYFHEGVGGHIYISCLSGDRINYSSLFCIPIESSVKHERKKDEGVMLGGHFEVFFLFYSSLILMVYLIFHVLLVKMDKRTNRDYVYEDLCDRKAVN